MEALATLIKAAATLGAAIFILGGMALYGAYALESHCWSPMGCIDPVEAKQDRENDAILRCGTRWQECVGNSYTQYNLPKKQK